MKWIGTRRTLLLNSAALVSNLPSTRNGQGGAIAETGRLGFTQVLPTAPWGQGRGFAGHGSRIIYVSYQSGSDINPGTHALPMKTLYHATQQLRDGHPDQLLLKCGDTWPPSDYFASLSNPRNGWANLNGAGPGILGYRCTGPMLISFYGTGKRPLLLVDSTSPLGAPFSATYNNSVYTCNNVAIIGLEVYGHRRDPTSPQYTFVEACATPVGVASLCNTSWFLVEDCRFSYLAEAPLEGATMSGTVIFRRNIFYHHYALGAGSALKKGHCSALFLSTINQPILDENVFVYSGWEPALVAPQDIKIDAATDVCTWPTTPVYIGEGAELYVKAGGGGLKTGTPYYAINVRGNKFQISISPGGPPQSISVSSSTMMWADAALTYYNHHVYLDSSCGTNNAIVTNNIAIWSDDIMVRTGGLIAGNYCAYNLNSLSVGIGPHEGSSPETFTTRSDVNHNVCQHASDMWAPAVFNDPADYVYGPSAGATNLQQCRGPNVYVRNNIYSMTKYMKTNIIGIAPQSSKCTVSGNIGFNWSVAFGCGLIGDAGSDNSISENVSDLVGSNSEAYIAPTRDINSYNAEKLGGDTAAYPAGLANFIKQACGNNPGEGRALQTWPFEYSAAALIAYISDGFVTRRAVK